ncbi:MAG: hypothetical protein LBN26_07960 [Christensenellaceae bacterium]|jgi:hypothetical protein|nr:hypothetical protein [Christensenellaceae bacterium]
MQSKIIPLTGPGGRGTVTVKSDNGQAAAETKPPITGGLWLVGEGGEVQRAGNSSFALSFAPVAALVYEGGEFSLGGGFGGRDALRARASRDIRIACMAGEAPRAPKARAAQSAAVEPAFAQKEAAPIFAQKEPGRAASPAPMVRQVQPAQPVQRAKPNAGAPEPPRARSEELLAILRKAEELFDADAAGGAAEGTGIPQPLRNPFPQAFPGARWQRVGYPGTQRYYLAGETVQRGVRYALYALPGEYAPVPPKGGFRRFLRASDGSGYWIRMMRKQ